ncbi:SgrR family transcriptional regulator [uncultured Brevibacillus sp.]|uniref:SgrR family transcriptional regulator n=1 Tax=uncultured Brevibacillus sp. TaxID=169970 RepID=UPI0025915972|nr:SgrR family transcriptional regulator [uncultured Brevibacillus sp.]
MQIAQHYLRLRQHFAGRQEKEQQEVTLAELAAVFFCTIRNAKMIIKQLAEQDWIEWMPGRGRGNVSRIVFLRSVEQVVVSMAKAHVAQGDLDKAMHLLADPKIPLRAKERFFEWLSGQFGFRSEEIEKRTRDTLRMSFYRTIPALDPPFVGRRTESHMVKQIFDTLIRFDERQDAFVPHLAHHWEVDESGTQWTFYLRKGVLFHHGRELTAHDVVWTFERIADPKTKSPYRYMLSDVDRIIAVKETTVVIKLRRPNHMLLSFLASDRMSIIPGEVVAQKGAEFTRLPVGSGPFRLIRNDEQMFILEAVPTYFLGRAHLDRVEIWVVPQNSLREDYFSSQGEVHFQTFWRCQEPLERWSGLERIERGSSYLAFNLNRTGPLQKEEVRHAIHSLLDREKMIADLGGNRHVPAHGFLPDEKAVLSSKAPIHIQRAQEVLQKRIDKDERISLFTYEGAGNENNAEWLQKHFAQYGLLLEVTVVPIEELKKPEILLQADMVFSGEVFDEQWELGLVELYKSDASFLRMMWDPVTRAQMDEQLDLLMQEQDKEAQREHLREIEDLLREQHALLFVFHSLQQSAYHSALAGVSLNALGLVEYKNIWFKQ